MDEPTYSNLSVKGNGSNPGRTRFERLLGVPGAERDTVRPAGAQPSKQFTHNGPRGGTRLERFLGVSSSAGDITRPAPSPSAGPSSSKARTAGVGTGLSKYAVPAVAALSVGILGLGVWTSNLHSEVASLKKAVAAESSADAAVVRQLKEAEADLELIGARLDEVENGDLSAIEKRLTEIERGLGRRR